VLRCRIGEEGVDALAQVAAGVSAKAVRVQSHLVGQARDAQPRQPPGDAHRVECAEQLQGAVFGAVGARDACQGAKAEQYRLGKAASFEHVEPVGEQRGSVFRLVALPQRRGEQCCQHAGEGIAPAELALGARQRRPQQLLGEQHLAFPQVGEPGDEVAPAADVAQPRPEVAARRLLLAQARERGLPIEQRAERRAVGVHVQ
jgi:hypothetical protein